MVVDRRLSVAKSCMRGSRCATYHIEKFIYSSSIQFQTPYLSPLMKCYNRSRETQYEAENGCFSMGEGF